MMLLYVNRNQECGNVGGMWDEVETLQLLHNDIVF